MMRIVSPARARLADGLEPLLPKPSWTPISVAPPATLYLCLMLSACAIVFLVVWGLGLRLPAHPWAAALPLMVIGAVEGAIGIVQGQNTDPLVNVLGTFGNRNHYAGFLEMVLPFAVLYPFAALGRYMHRRRGEPLPMAQVAIACVSLVGAALILAGILYSRSRMGYLAALGSLMCIALIALSRGRSWPQVGMFALGVVVLALLGSFFVIPDQLLSRMAQAAPKERVIVWRDTRHLIAAYPLVGCGLGGYEYAFVKYKASNPALDQDYAHNDYLQYFAELGLAGFALAAAPVILILNRLRKAWQDPVRPRVGWLNIACAGSLIAIGIHSLADFNMYIPANMFSLAWILGIGAYSGALNRKPEAGISK
jgi:O-antigen ligase